MGFVGGIGGVGVKACLRDHELCAGRVTHAHDDQPTRTSQG